MKKPAITAVAVLGVLATIGLVGLQLMRKPETDSAATNGAEVESAPVVPSRVSAFLTWTTQAGESGELQVVDGARLDAAGVVAVTYSSDLTPRVRVAGGEPQSPAVKASGLKRLGVRIELKDGPTLTRTVFDRERLDGRAGPQAEDAYAVVLAAGSAETVTALPESTPAPVARMVGVARRYLSQEDASDVGLAASYGVTTAQVLPRVIVAAEEWYPFAPPPRPKSGGPLGALTRAMDGKTAKPAKPAKVKKVPSTSIDVLLDRLEARGDRAFAYQTARSLWSDVLEAKVIHEVTGRRALSAMVVFAQASKLAYERKKPLQTVVVDAGSLERLTTCRDLPKSTGDDVRAFLTEVPHGKAILPAAPVPFFDSGKTRPAYAVYAWFQVDPRSGRWVGRTADSLHGGLSDLGARMAQGAADKVREKGKAELNKRSGPALRAFFGAVSGMYVASAGVLDATTLTIANPNIAALSGKSWTEFVALHALNYATAYLQEHADIYDDFASRAGYWGGVAAIVGNLGGAPALKETAKRAFKDLSDQVKKAAQEKVEELAKGGLEDAFGPEADTIYKAVKQFGEPNQPERTKSVEEIRGDLAESIGKKLVDAATGG